MRRPVIAAAALAVLALACARSSYKPSSDEPATTYMEACASCHDGSTPAPVLTGRRLTPEAVERRLDRGGAGMPAFPGIRGEARKRLVAFVVEMSGGKSPTAP
jgi:mono/diheme cytochrome c family protein